MLIIESTHYISSGIMTADSHTLTLTPPTFGHWIKTGTFSPVLKLINKQKILNRTQ